jgi:aminoglycoside 3-N-acetyltransferase
MAEMVGGVETPQVTKEGIKRGLAEVGIREGDLVFCHSSLSAFGQVDGGADAVIDALLEAVGSAGTVVVPTFTWGSNHAKAVALFDVANDPSEVGKITEVFHKRPGVMRNEHVCHSVAAIGPQAEAVMGDSVRPFAGDASLYRCYELDSWYLLMGCDFGSATALHTVEEIAQVPYRSYRDFEGSTVIRPDGTEVPSQSVEYLMEDGLGNDFQKMGDVFASEGILRRATVGKATFTNARIRDVIDHGTAHMEQDILYLLSAEAKKRWLAREQG